VTGSGSLVLSGPVQTGTTSLIKSGAGTLTLGGNNANTGTYTVSAGTLKLGASERIADTAALSLTSTFDMAGFDETIGALSGSGKIVNGGNLTVGTNNANSTFSGSIAGNGALTKVGTGALALTSSDT